MIRILMLSLGILVFGAGTTWAREPVSTAGIPQLLSELRGAYQKIKTLSADFVQTLEMDGLDDAERITGKLAYSSPNRFRIDYLEPVDYRQWILSDGQSIYFFVEANNEVMQKPIPKKGDGNQLVKNLFPWLNNLHKYNLALLSQNAKTISISIEPKEQLEDESFRKLIIHLDPKSLLLLQTQMTDSNNNATTFQFVDVAIGKTLAADKFSFKLPAGASMTVSE